MIESKTLQAGTHHLYIKD